MSNGCYGGMRPRSAPQTPSVRQTNEENAALFQGCMTVTTVKVHESSRVDIKHKRRPFRQQARRKKTVEAAKNQEETQAIQPTDEETIDEGDINFEIAPPALEETEKTEVEIDQDQPLDFLNNNELFEEIHEEAAQKYEEAEKNSQKDIELQNAPRVTFGEEALTNTGAVSPSDALLDLNLSSANVERLQEETSFTTQQNLQE